MVDTRNNLFLRLQKWAWGQEENFVTELFAYLLQHLLQFDGSAASIMLANLTGGAVPAADWDATSTKVSTQVTVGGKRPDIEISAPGLLVYVEVKVESTLGVEQLLNYRKILQTSGVARTYLVLLTRYEEQAPESQQPDSAVLWYQVAQWLENAMRAELVKQPSSVFLVEQFLGFLRGRRMTMERIGSEMAAGARSLTSLYSMLHKALTSAGLDLGKSLEYNWWGCKIGTGQYYVGVYLHEAFLLRFRTLNDRIDRAKAEALGRGRLWTEGGRLRWEHVIDLSAEEAGFFSMSTDEQMRFVEDFVKESLRMARDIVIQEDGDQPAVVEQESLLAGDSSRALELGEQAGADNDC
ncbi:MAG TPA: PD-(D/E)XK nuclease family protein [Chloroflexia bacterium]|nr:PD-(D/E)XK nuclease family protein [Chloroflexia bacterium]